METSRIRAYGAEKKTIGVLCRDEQWRGRSIVKWSWCSPEPSMILDAYMCFADGMLQGERVRLVERKNAHFFIGMGCFLNDGIVFCVRLQGRRGGRKKLKSITKLKLNIPE
ncbi:hypothetical protein ILYODFUR_007561 [Ilyodon furcidens]|uniref:Uncharacterized protein n=1 Tax=Ilyodon furcidens TaxID=33524 RepID=A0ABV0SJA7_9TELE